MTAAPRFSWELDRDPILTDRIAAFTEGERDLGENPDPAVPATEKGKPDLHEYRLPGTFV